MLCLFKVELAKIRRSPMLLVGLIGGVMGPGLNLVTVLLTGTDMTWEAHLQQSMMFYGLLMGTMLVGLIATFVFVREITDDTMKSTLVTPFSRPQIYLAKAAVILLCVLGLTMVGFVTTVLVGVLLGMKDGDSLSLLTHMRKFLFLGLGLYAATPITILVSLISKNYPVPIGYLIFATLVGIAAVNSDMAYLVPWSSPLHFAADPSAKLVWSVSITLFLGTAINLFYFTRMDVS